MGVNTYSSHMKTLDLPVASSVENDIEQLRKTGRAQELGDRPFFHYIRTHELTKEEHKKFFCQYYTIVCTSYRMLALGILHTRATSPSVITHLADFLWTESGDRVSHLEYYQRWAQAFGVSPVDLETTEFNETSANFERTLMSYFETEDDLPKLAAQLGVEDCAGILISGLNEGFKRYPMTPRAYAYLAAHLVLENDEDGHSRWAIDALAKYPNIAERFSEVEGIYRDVCAAFIAVFDGIYKEWKV